MKSLIVFYSRTGVTRRAANSIAQALSCDVEEIVDAKDRMGVLGYLRAGRDAMRKRHTIINNPRKNPDDYDCVVIGTPVWAARMAPAIRTFISRQKGKLKRVAFFCTYGGSGGERTFIDLEQACEKKPVALLGLSSAEINRSEHHDKVNVFANKLWRVEKKIKNSPVKAKKKTHKKN
ncbi:MAG: NAD(P)H-dependent oxidoreductase [archaeon]